MRPDLVSNIGGAVQPRGVESNHGKEVKTRALESTAVFGEALLKAAQCSMFEPNEVFSGVYIDNSNQLPQYQYMGAGQYSSAGVGSIDHKNHSRQSPGNNVVGGTDVSTHEKVGSTEYLLGNTKNRGRLLEALIEVKAGLLSRNGLIIA